MCANILIVITHRVRTQVDYFHSAVSENPYFGIDWQRLVNTPEQA